MATVKIKTDVDTAAFKGFTDVFERFATTLGAQSDAWTMLGERAGTAGARFEAAAAHSAAMAESLAGVVEHLNHFERASNVSAGHWTKLARSTKDVAVHIGNATVALLKWSAITGIVSGLMGGGALFGINVLGGSVASTRATALGTGTTYGGLQAFRTNFQRYGDGQGFLERVNAAQIDSSKRLPFGALGIPEEDWTKKSSSELGVEVVQRMKDWLDKTPLEVLGTNMQTTGLDQLMSPQEAQRLKSEDRSKTDQFGADVARDTRTMQLDPAAQKKWADFVAQMSRAGTEVETVFEKNLVKLTPGLTALSDSFTHLVAHLLEKNGPAEHWLGELNTGLEWLATHIDTPEFQAGVTKFMDGVVKIGTAIFGVGRGLFRLLHWFAQLDGDVTGAGGGSSLTSLGGPSTIQHSFGARGDLGVGGGGGGDASWVGKGGHAARANMGKWWTPERIQHAYDRLTSKGIAPRAAEAAIARWAFVESPNGPESSNTIGGGHKGIKQWSRSRWEQHVRGDGGFDAQLDAHAEEFFGSESKAGNYMQHAQTDHDAAVGMSRDERAEGWNGSQDAFVGRTEQGMPKIHAIVARPRTTVTLQKNTGGNPITTSAAVAAPQ